MPRRNKDGYKAEWQDGRWILRIRVGKVWRTRSGNWKTKKAAEDAGPGLYAQLNGLATDGAPQPGPEVSDTNSETTIEPKLKTDGQSENLGEIQPSSASGTNAALEPEVKSEQASGEKETPVSYDRKSFGYIFLQKVEYHVKKRRLKNPTPIRQGAKYILSGLKKHAHDEVPDQKPCYWAKCREWLIDKSNLSANTLETYTKGAREVLKRYLVGLGLNPDCIEQVERLPIAAIAAADNSEAAGLPFSRPQLEIIFEKESAQSDTVRLLTWLGASGGLQIGDATFFRLEYYDPITRMVRGRRVKTKAIYEFKALPPLHELLVKRRAELGEKAVYALPELIFTREQRRDPECNTVPWDDVPADYMEGAASCAGTKVAEFLEQCGIKCPELTQKSWRKLLISVWASLGLREKVRMRMAGHRALEEHIRYDTPAHFEMGRTADVVWRMFCAIKAKKPFFIPTTVFDVYDALHEELERLPEIIAQRVVGLLVEENKRLHEKLDAVVAENKTLHQKVDGLRSEVQGLHAKLDTLLTRFDQDCVPNPVESLVSVAA